MEWDHVLGISTAFYVIDGYGSGLIHWFYYANNSKNEAHFAKQHLIVEQCIQRMTLMIIHSNKMNKLNSRHILKQSTSAALDPCGL